jgi:hypothetical protein
MTLRESAVRVITTLSLGRGVVTRRWRSTFARSTGWCSICCTRRSYKRTRARSMRPRSCTQDPHTQEHLFLIIHHRAPSPPIFVIGEFGRHNNTLSHRACRQAECSLQDLHRLAAAMNWTRTHFSRYCGVSTIEPSSWPRQTYLLEFRLCLQLDDICMLCDNTSRRSCTSNHCRRLDPCQGPRDRKKAPLKLRTGPTGILLTGGEITRRERMSGAYIVALTRDDEVTIGDDVFSVGSVDIIHEVLVDLGVLSRLGARRSHDCLNMVWRLLERVCVYLTNHRDAVELLFEVHPMMVTLDRTPNGPVYQRLEQPWAQVHYAETPASQRR